MAFNVISLFDELGTSEMTSTDSFFHAHGPLLLKFKPNEVTCALSHSLYYAATILYRNLNLIKAASQYGTGHIFCQ